MALFLEYFLHLLFLLLLHNLPGNIILSFLLTGRSIKSDLSYDISKYSLTKGGRLGGKCSSYILVENLKSRLAIKNYHLLFCIVRVGVVLFLKKAERNCKLERSLQSSNLSNLILSKGKIPAIRQ
jgi:hypothetical protein